jgi:hypothetical protein
MGSVVDGSDRSKVLWFSEEGEAAREPGGLLALRSGTSMNRPSLTEWNVQPSASAGSVVRVRVVTREEKGVECVEHARSGSEPADLGPAGEIAA